MTWRPENDAEEEDDTTQTLLHIPRRALLFHLSAMFDVN